jgi:hypothetical protein
MIISRKKKEREREKKNNKKKFLNSYITSEIFRKREE